MSQTASTELPEHQQGISSESYDNVVWTDELEAMLKKWGEQGKGLSWMHGKCDQWFSFWDKSIGLPAGALAIGAGLATAGSPANDITKWIFGAIMIIAGVLTWIQNYLGWGKRSAMHEEAVVQYQIFADDIESQLALRRDQRQPGKKFYKSMTHRHNTLTSRKYPNIIDRYVTEYNLRLYNSAVARPVVAGGITEIQVNQKESLLEPKSKAEEKDSLQEIIIDQILSEERNNPAVQDELERFQRK
jgi:hypothetical protein